MAQPGTSGPRQDANLVLTGFMGTGKSAVGREVARRLGREFMDMDDLIVRRSGQSIPTIFERRGEAAFRQMEAELCRELSLRRDLVVATGGGALLPEANRRWMEGSGLVICLSCSLDEVLQRLSVSSDRPLLEVSDRRAEIERLLESRQHAYGAMPAHLDTTRLTVEEAAEQVLALWHAWHEEEISAVFQSSSGQGSLTVHTPEGEYRIHLNPGELARLGERLREMGSGEPVAVVSNPLVWQLYGPAVEAALKAAGLTYLIALMPDGEEHKTLTTVARLYESFLAGGLERSGVVIAVGGGVVGDVAGFAAATYLRGVPLVQVPTTLLSMVDSSVGGKTGVDLSAGKNLVGAFKQPLAVLTDPDLLRTLPPAEVRSGLAEIVKAGIIGAPDLFEYLERCYASLSPPGLGSQNDEALESWDWGWVIRRALEVKIQVVEEDPLEQGRRAVLNLGHTVAHALERLSAFSMRHGEAVSIGLVAAQRLAVTTQQGDAALLERLTSLLRCLGLPTCLPDYDALAIWEAMQQDKKRRGGALRWVIPSALGDVFVTDEISQAEVLDVLAAMREV